MAFDRIVEIEVFENPSSKLRIDNLEVEFRVERSNTFAENSLDLKIYNMNSSTQKTVLKKGNNIIIKTGYADETVKTIFIGNISYSATAYDGIDYITNVKAVMGRGDTKSFESITASFSYARDTLLSTVLDEIATAYGLSITGSVNAQINLPKGMVFSGTARGALKQCAKILRDNGIGLYIDNNEIVIYKIGESSQFNVIFLSFDSGLLSAHKITEPGEDKTQIEFKALMVSSLSVGDVIKVSHPEVDGTYIIEKLTFYGDNYGGDFNVKGEATA